MHAVPDYEHLLDDRRRRRRDRGLQPARRDPARSTRRPRASRPSTGSRPAPAPTRTSRRGSARCGSACATSTGREEFLESLREADIVRTPANLLYVQALKFLQTKATPRGARARGRASAASGGRHASADARARDTRRRRRIPVEPMPATDDEIREKYLERAIRELNRFTRDLQACRHCPRGNLMPVLGSGHPQADVFLLKYAPQARRDRGGRRLLRPRRHRADEVAQAPGHRPARRLRDAVREVPGRRPARSPTRRASRG